MNPFEAGAGDRRPAPGGSADAPVLAQVTLAVNRGEAMAAFYNAVLDTGLSPFQASGATLWKGELAGVNLLLCPNEIAGVDARQARHQFLMSVQDVRAACHLAVETGGSADPPVNEGGRETAILRDPDGNTIEITELP